MVDNTKTMFQNFVDDETLESAFKDDIKIRYVF